MRGTTTSRAVACAAVTAVVVAALALTPVSPALAATSMAGRATCGANSAGQFVGMWVSTNAGGGGWASWSATSNPMIATYSRSVPSNATTISVAVGCGGTTGSWGQTYYGSIPVGAGAGAVGKDWICLVGYGSPICA